MEYNYDREDVIRISNRNLETASAIIRELNIENVWKKHSGQANSVGSVRTKLLMDHLDIDFHVYTDTLTIADSFSAIGEIAQSPRIREVQYGNLLDQEDACLEWHLKYLDNEKRFWQIDIIHILKGSKYDGKFERVADKINSVMTEERRSRILMIKYEAGLQHQYVTGIEVYKAVIEDGIKNYREFEIWHRQNKTDGIIEWEPGKEANDFTE